MARNCAVTSNSCVFVYICTYLCATVALCWGKKLLTGCSAIISVRNEPTSNILTPIPEQSLPSTVVYLQLSSATSCTSTYSLSMQDRYSADRSKISQAWGGDIFPYSVANIHMQPIPKVTLTKMHNSIAKIRTSSVWKAIYCDNILYILLLVTPTCRSNHLEYSAPGRVRKYNNQN